MSDRDGWTMLKTQIGGYKYIYRPYDLSPGGVDVSRSPVAPGYEGDWRAVDPHAFRAGMEAEKQKQEPEVEGFTWEMVDELREAARDLELADTRIMGRESKMRRFGLRDIADRIAALLPPREEP